MNEQWKEQLEMALKEPPAPEALVERTIRRCRAVTGGRLAEERLAKEGGSLSKEERCALAADGLLGRLAMQTDLPEGLNRKWLMGQESFRKAADVPAPEVLSGLRRGTILRQMTEQKPGRCTAPARKELGKDGAGLKTRTPPR